MIQTLSTRYSRPIAFYLTLLFYLQFFTALCAGAVERRYPSARNWRDSLYIPRTRVAAAEMRSTLGANQARNTRHTERLAADIGGPNSPEASSFKAVGADNLVNLFTGDFSYSVPLLDVGGYPVNLFYSGGIGMEQEASWVGLGWNINPGSVSRNMRGVPDDFNGTDKLLVTQNVKPNRTWGGEVGIDGELLGTKIPRVGFSLGFSYNNYLGPELTLGASASVNLLQIQTIKFDKAAPDSLTISMGVGAKLSSRSGLTLTPSLNAKLSMDHGGLELGAHASTSYNSRSGLKSLNISSEMSMYRQTTNTVTDNEGKVVNSTSYGRSWSAGLTSSSISFSRPSYMPSIRMPMRNSTTSGQFELGLGAYGLRASARLSGFYTESVVPASAREVQKPLVGFLYADKAMSDRNAVMDFNRVNDGEVTPNTPVISAPQYTYDVFSIQGEGTGGTIRAYRSDLGYMKDNRTVSTDDNFDLGLDIAPVGHFGANLNDVYSPTVAGSWEDNNLLAQAMPFAAQKSNTSFENVYFRNPGEATVVNPQLFDRIGGDAMVRFELSGSDVNPRLDTRVRMFDKLTASDKGTKSLSAALSNRDKRTQLVTMLTASEAAAYGSNRYLRNYNSILAADTLQYSVIARVSDYRKAHHISEIDVLEQSGMRYEYGLPVYNKTQSDFTFSVGGNPDATDIVGYNLDDPTTNSRWIANDSRLDGYVQNQKTPAYASAFLLTALLSPDYVDVTNNGVTDDDLGTAVRFNYAMSSNTHKWRTPRGGVFARSAHFNAGIKTERRDNKASVSYGEREVWYLSSIESKTMVAIFKTGSRLDAKGVIGEANGGINSSESANKRLNQIDLYTKAELRAHPSDPKPVKTVHFEYNYKLCPGTPDNANSDSGKLTLVAVSFSYNGQVRSKKDRYVFNYGNPAAPADNPVYAAASADRWGSYKPASMNPGSLNNSDYPFSVPALNNASAKQQMDDQAGAWSLKKILLPSGGQMEISYEADDYAYVQDRRSCNMMAISGLGLTSSFPSSAVNRLYTTAGDPLYLYVHLPQPLASADPAKAKREIYERYLEGLKQLAFKLTVQMPKGEEIINSYALFNDYGLCPNSLDRTTIFIHLAPQDGKSPLALASTGFLINNIPGQAFDGYEIEPDGLEGFIEMVGDMLSSLKDAFTEVDEQMRGRGRGQFINLDRSFVRLDNPYKMRYGGGVRVKKVVVKDNWNKMTGQYQSTYGQEYDYSTKELINGVETVISSGVASYEPSIGGEENPFREIISFSNKLPLASAQYGAMEMPILDALYPAPCVGYSKVTVRSIHRKGTHSDSTLRSSIGKQVTEFYTARDFPTISNFTPYQERNYHRKPPFSFFYKQMIDQRILSQGFLVQTNDMHGKMKAQLAFSERDEKTPLSASYHTYRNTGANGLNDKVDFVYNSEGGAVRKGNIGIDIDLMTDVREFKALSEGLNVHLQVDIFYVPPPMPVPTLFPLVSHIENNYRAVTCTKVINFHAIEDSVTVMDKGSIITTRTIAYDAETGSPIVTKTANEFNDPIYKTTYPAHWAYKGIGPAYINAGMQFSGVNFTDGKLSAPTSLLTNFESGDELYVTNTGAAPGDCIDASSESTRRLWVFDKRKNSTALQTGAAELIFMDEEGRPYHRSGVAFRIIRSGHRNNLGSTVAEATSLQNPLQGGYLILNNSAQVVAASAVEYKEKWASDWDVFGKHALVATDCAMAEVEDCSGYLDRRINPYLKGLVGTLRPWRSLVYYGARTGPTIGVAPTIRRDGYIDGFAPYWTFDGTFNLQPQVTNTNWVWNSELTKVNAKGQELETRDALNVYTAAQYGYNKSLPVSVTKNARSQAAAYDGFEDYAFQDVLNTSERTHCPRRHIDFADSLGFHLVNTDTTAFTAHTGLYAARVNSNSIATKAFGIAFAPDSFDLRYPMVSTGLLLHKGGTLYPNLISAIPSGLLPGRSFYGDGNSGFIAKVTFDPTDPFEHFCMGDSTSVDFRAYSFATRHYVQILECDTYRFRATRQDRLENGEPVECSGTTMALYNASGARITPSDSSHILSANVYDYYLSPGVYRIEGTVTGGGIYNRICDPACGWDNITPCSVGAQSNGDCGVGPENFHLISLYRGTSSSTNPLPAYVDDESGCYFTPAIAANDSMVNPAFAFSPGKKMLFSAWVREGCAGCGENGYTNNTIVLSFAGAGTNVTLYPSGNVIEGWQRYEAVFEVPGAATGVTLTVNNAGSAPLYLDDLRLHPYNANMKSYVYDTHSLRLSAELDENNYASYYEYDEEGQLVRVKKETIQGVKTIRETRSAKQKVINDVQ